MDLKPCPFCGGEAHHDFFKGKIQVGDMYRGVCCKNCGALIKERSQLKTAKNWNSRIYEAGEGELILYQCANMEIMDFFDGKGDKEMAKQSYKLIITKFSELLKGDISGRG